MSIFNHFQNISLTDDQRHALEKLHAFLESEDQVFILQGYAGSGKTTLLKGIVTFINELKKSFVVMAPTGRAAKILRDKTGFGQTIHREIYNFEELEIIQDKENTDDHSFHYYFPIRKLENQGNVFIVDEASMISSRESNNELYTFGTNILLNDLLTFSKIPFANNKIIFVGDPAQLPPVGDNESKALMPEYFEQLNIKTQTAKLQQVVRQQENLILSNAIKIRKTLETTVRNEFSFDYDDTNFIKIQSENLAQLFSEKYPLPELGQGVIIAYSNAQCLQYNNSIREKIFPQQPNVTVGDILLINQNNYHAYGVELRNGEMAKVMEVDNNVIRRENIPVYETINGKRVKKHITLHFREVKIRVENYQEEINCLIIDSLLNSPNRDLSISEMKALYIDFVMRFQEQQKKREEEEEEEVGEAGETREEKKKIGSEEFKNQLRQDPYFNALRVKYGYAITCHKAQGGEWKTIFIDYYGRTSLKNDPLRWCYTATTRAVEKCFASNAPNLTVFSKFEINAIQPLAKIPENALALNNVPQSPFHSAEMHKAKSLKYWEINEKLENSSFQIQSVQSLGNFQERYAIAFENEVSLFDSYHNGAGIFNEFNAVHPNQFNWQEEALLILNKPYAVLYNVDYQPSLPILEKVSGLMQVACEEAEIVISNIEERVKDYYVLYFLKTDAKCAIIQFYFNGKGQLTRALPKSTEGGNDHKLVTLISILQSYVI